MPGLALDPMIAWLLRLGLAGVFMQAAVHKARDLDAAAQIIADYKVTPVEWATFHAVAVVLAELFVAVGLVVAGFAPADGSAAFLSSASSSPIPSSVAPADGLAAHGGLSTLGLVAALVAIGLLVLYSGAIGLNLVRGRRDIDCGCLGPAGRSPRIGPWLIVRNGVLALGAAVLAVSPISSRPLHWIDAVSVAGGLAALALVWVAVHVIAATAPLVQSRERTP